MKKNITLLLVFFIQIINSQTITKMENFKIIKKQDIKLRDYDFVGEINTNFANYYRNSINQSVLLYPQEGFDCVIFDNNKLFDSLILENNFPLLNENKSVYLEYKDILNSDSLNSKNIDFSEIRDVSIDTNGFDDLFFINAEHFIKKKTLDEKKKIFAFFLAYFGNELKSKLNLVWDKEIKYYLYPYEIPFLYDKELNISLYRLNELLYDKIILDKKFSFKKIIIDVYSDYYEKRFYLTSQNNYFDKKDYKKRLNKEFDKYYIFPFVDIWQLPKIEIK